MKFDFTLPGDIPLAQRRFTIPGIGTVTADNVYLKVYAKKPAHSWKHDWQNLLLNEETEYEFALSGEREVYTIKRVK